ncbi:hypothetical protein COCNU_scaffold007664G000020 [Cocos nucifera]|nr:hypothetical protein [Cocos nucifera]
MYHQPPPSSHNQNFHRTVALRAAFPLPRKAYISSLDAHHLCAGDEGSRALSRMEGEEKTLTKMAEAFHDLAGSWLPTRAPWIWHA